MPAPSPFPVGGYVLAGGRSSRMGADKSLLQLAGRPLVQHAVTKLRRVCAEVHILSSNPVLAAYAPLVSDIHSNCGPIGGMEAALTHSTSNWNLFLAVDMPFLPADYIWACVREWIQSHDEGARIRMVSNDGRPQPGFCLLHKEVLPFLSEAISHSDHKLMRVFEAAGRELALLHGCPANAGLCIIPMTSKPTTQCNAAMADRHFTSSVQQATPAPWFANLNTREDFADAEAHVDALDT